ncbi:MAG: threonine aldolase family protein [Candidatus Pelethousia sp.]|nr:threonine aldolase family protein [Candidatus Pelethousia sp.]
MSLTISEIKKLLDLRSDTSTTPTENMWEAMHHAAIGDGGRVDLTGRGEDPTVYELEQLAARLLGKEEAMYVATGSLANHVAMYAATNRGDKVLVEKTAHIYINEKYDFMDKFTGLEPIFYHLNRDYQIEPSEIQALLLKHDIKVLCLENTHNYSGGTCLTPACTKTVCDMAHKKGLHVHLDGARVFNAAVALRVDVKELVAPVDSVMFCLSKGLCAPVGSMLVGSKEFIKEARAVGKMIGTPMRQAGVIAAAGIVALKENISRLAEDHAKALRLGQLLSVIPNAIMDPKADQSDFVYMNVTPTGLTAQQVTDGLREKGLLVAKMTDESIRLAAHKDISMKQVEEAAAIVISYFASL